MTYHSSVALVVYSVSRKIYIRPYIPISVLERLQEGLPNPIDTECSFILL